MTILRNVGGANRGKLRSRFLLQFSWWMIISNIVAWPLSNFAMKNRLQNFTYRIEFPFWTFILSLLLSLTIAVITGKIFGNRYINNGVSADASGFVPDMSADIYYEVVRLIDGKLLFLPDHLERLGRSLSGTGIEYPGNNKLLENLRLLLDENPFEEGNIRICIQKSGGMNPLLKCYFIPYLYPDSTMYKEGVKLITYPHQRPNPGIKKWDDLFRKSVSSYIREHDVYEAILVNSKQQITEGSRSNIFFIDRADNLITVPEKDVLPGITRKYILEIAREKGINTQERTLLTAELDSMVSVFISGTSPKVLPVKLINDQHFDVSHPLLRMLMAQFEQLENKNLTQL